MNKKILAIIVLLQIFFAVLAGVVFLKDKDYFKILKYFRIFKHFIILFLNEISIFHSIFSSNSSIVSVFLLVNTYFLNKSS